MLDVATRWNSTYTMLDTLLKFEDFCEQHLELPFKLTYTEWLEMKELVSTLKPVYIATQKLQSTQLYMGDFYKLWLELKLAVGALKSFHSETLQQCFLNREKVLTDNNVVICSIYLDPRIRRVLLQTPSIHMHARAQLKQLMLKIFNLYQNVSN